MMITSRRAGTGTMAHSMIGSCGQNTAKASMMPNTAPDAPITAAYGVVRENSAPPSPLTR